jgi:flagellar biosynthesis protein FlhF
MQIKEFEAYTLKECLQQVRDDLGPDAVILETRKFRKGGLLGVGARDAVCIVAATGIAVKEEESGRQGTDGARTSNGRGVHPLRRDAESSNHSARPEPARRQTTIADEYSDAAATATGKGQAALAAARSAYSRQGAGARAPQRDEASPRAALAKGAISDGTRGSATVSRTADAPEPPPVFRRNAETVGRQVLVNEEDRFGQLERAMREIRDGLQALQREQKEGQERTLSAVVSAVAPALNAVAGTHEVQPELPPALAALQDRLIGSGIAPALAGDLLDALPDLSAWSEPAREPLALSAIRDLISRRVGCSGPIMLTPGRLKAVAMIGPTGVGKTTTIAKLAAHFALTERKRVALLTVDTYRIAAVEQLKTYSNILDLPISVAYNQSEVMPVIRQYADYDLLLIDTAGRSQKNIMQVGELKSLLELVNCETHLVLSASMKEQDMIEAARRFSAARVDRMIFSKLDETDTHGTLISVSDATGIPLSYLTNGQKVPEDIVVADSMMLANMVLNRAES